MFELTKLVPSQKFVTLMDWITPLPMIEPPLRLVMAPALRVPLGAIWPAFKTLATVTFWTYCVEVPPGVLVMVWNKIGPMWRAPGINPAGGVSVEIRSWGRGGAR